MFPFSPIRCSVPPLARLVVALGSTSGVLSAQVVIPEWQLPPVYGEGSPNYVEASGAYAFIDGDEGAFAQRNGFKNYAAGIEDSYFFREFDESELTIRLQALAGSNEIGVDVHYEEWDSYYLHFGVRQNRSFYDASGGYYPFGDEYIFPDKSTRALDYGRIWFEWGNIPEDGPQVRIRFTHYYRKGEKNSTIWGRGAARYISPAYLDINENREVIDLEVQEIMEEQRWVVSGRFEHASTDNTLHTVNRPYSPNPQPLADNTSVQSNMGGGYAYYARQLDEKTNLSIGASILSLDANLGGYREITNGTAYGNLNGNSDFTYFVLSGNLDYLWTPEIQSTLSFNFSGEDIDGHSQIKNGVGPNYLASSQENYFLNGVFETQYTGIEKLVLLGSLELGKGYGNLNELGNNIHRYSDIDQKNYTIRLRARYYAIPGLSFMAEYYREAKYDNYANTRLDFSTWAYPGFVHSLDYVTDDVNARATWRPLLGLTLVSRVDYQFNTVNTTFEGLPAEQESRFRSLVFSQSASWTPIDSVYLQGAVTYSKSFLSTPINQFGGALSLIVPETANDYWSADFNVFAVLDEQTDLQGGYHYYFADNYTDNSFYGQPYGSKAQEHWLDIQLSRQITENMRLSLRYGYARGDDDSTADYNDFEAHILYANIRYNF